MPRTGIHHLSGLAVLALVATDSAGATVYTCPDPISHRPVLSQLPCDKAPSPAEIAAAAEAKRLAQIRAETLAAAKIEDLRLMRLYPDEASHRNARAADLNAVVARIRIAMVRFGDLRAERRHIDSEAEFYKGKPRPVGLQRSIDASEAGFAALVDIFNGLRSDIADIEARRSLELARLRSLWAGTQPGSMAQPLAHPASTPAT